MAPGKPRPPKPKTAKPKVKKDKEKKKTKPVSSFDIMVGWRKELRDLVYGLHPGASALDRSKAEYAFASTNGKYYCRRCSKCLRCNITVITRHSKSKGCTRADKSKTFTGVFLPSKQNVMPVFDVDVLRGLSSAYLLANGISFNMQESLFNPTSDILRALYLLATHGLGSDKTIAENVSATVGRVESKLLQPILRGFVDKKIPFALLADESTTRIARRRGVMQIWLHSPLKDEPIPFDASIMVGTATGANIKTTIVSSLTRQGFLSEGEFRDHVAVVASDHASAMLSAIEDLGVTAVGDGPHAVELVIKAIIESLGVKPHLMLLRKVFNVGHSTVRARQLDAFGMPHGFFSM